ncbi:hypothetical protein [Nocardia carnea]|uniref:hypothetical protein n=1 Tax=Nocardia carnea TaxID=37328 RepID=UPI0024555066|nr:hypothetical protein [Nocardia carnea]
MARFKRLTRADLDTLTRDRLLERIEAEQKYWARMERGVMTDADQQARVEFTKILYTVVDLKGLAASMAQDAAWLRGERGSASSYWSEIPGQSSRT